MLIALLTAFLLGGGGGAAGAILTPAGVKELVNQVEATVADESRGSRAADALTELRRETKSFENDLDRSGKKLTNLFKNHGAEPAAMVEVLDELNVSWAESQRRAVELRFELKDALTEEEWNEVFGDD